MNSFWEKESLYHFDVVIVGAGLMGLSTAISLKEKSPNKRICILERGLIPAGASSRNAGFACFAKACEMLSDIKVQGEKAAAELAYERYCGLNLLRKRVGDDNMEYQELGGHELIFADEQVLSSGDIQMLNDLLSPYFNTAVFSEENILINKSGFKGIKQLIYNPFEGQIHSGKLVSSLWRIANNLGIRIITGADLQSINEYQNQVELQVVSNEKSYQFICESLAICTNALATKFLGETGMGVKPGRGQVLITEEITNLQFRGAYHFDEGFYYFRNVGNRVLFGGGRNLAIEEETTAEFGINSAIQQQLEEFLNEVILPNQNPKIEMRWSGIMGFTSNKMPLISKISARQFAGITCNGMGVALSTLSGDKMAELLI